MGIAQELTETFRLLNCVRQPSGDDLLDDLLNGFPKTVQNVAKLRAFCVRNFQQPPDAGDVQRIFAAIDRFLSANMSPSEFAKAIAPAPAPPSRYKNVVEEIEATDAIHDELQRLGVIKLPYVSREVKALVDRMVAEGRSLTPDDIDLFARLPRV